MSQPQHPEVRMHDPSWRAMQKYRGKQMQAQGIPTITLPGGVVIDGRSYRGIRPPGADKAFCLHSPEAILIDPKVGCRYVWRRRNDETTFGLVECHAIKPVSVDRINRKDRRTSSIYPYAGGTNSDGTPAYYAAWATMALFEVDPQVAYEWFTQPEEYALSKQVSMGETINESIQEEASKYGMQTETTLTRSNAQSAEKESRRPIDN